MGQPNRCECGRSGKPELECVQHGVTHGGVPFLFDSVGCGEPKQRPTNPIFGQQKLEQTSRLVALMPG
jgi:hypothetical protein